MALVAQGQTAKSIARELGISHRTVEQHIAGAIEVLDAKNRLGAVARFLELEQQQSSPVVHPAFMLQTPDSPEEAKLVGDEEPATEPAPPTSITWPLFPPLGGSTNDAPPKVRLGWIMRIAILAIMLTCAAILSILGVMEIAR